MTIQRLCGVSGLFALLVLGGCNERVLVGNMDGSGGSTGGAGSGGPFVISGAGGGSTDDPGYGGHGYGGYGGTSDPNPNAGYGGNGGVGQPPSATCSSLSTVPGYMNPCGRTYGVAYSPDGTMLATGDGPSMSLHVWHLPGGTILRDFGGSGIYDIAFSPDGRTLAICESLGVSNTSGAQLYDVASGTLLHALPTTAGGYVDTVAFSNDGTLLATGGGTGPIEVWKVADGTIVNRIPYPTSVHNVHFAPVGSQLIVGGVDERATIWNIPAGTLAMTLVGIADEMADADYSPDGRQIASTSSTNNDIKVWDAASGALLQTLSAHTSFVSHAVWINSDRFLTDDWSGVVHSWTRGNDGLFALSGTWNLGSQALGMAVSPDKTQAAVVGDGGIVFLAL
jgi:WD40-like Beta Propeller Repeat